MTRLSLSCILAGRVRPARRTRSSWRQLAGVVAVGVLGMTAACGGGADAPPLPEAALADTATLSAEALAIAGITTDTARLGAWMASVTVPGRVMLDPARLETIGSITEGRVKVVTVRVGDRVNAGDVLVMIHSHEIMDARSQLARAEAQLSSANAEYRLAVTAAERAARLLAAKAMSQAEVERAETVRIAAQAAVTQAEAEHERAEALVEHLAGLGPLPAGADPHDVLIRTPIAGVVVTRDVQPGTVVLPGQSLVTVGDPNALLLQLRVPERDATAARVGAQVRVTLTERPDVQLEARVTRVAPTVDRDTRTLEVLAAPVGRGTLPRAESYAQAELRAASGGEAIMVPQGAVQALEGDTIVIAASPRGAGLFIEAVPVRVGRRAGGMAEIRSGLEAGRVVVVQGAAIAKAELLKRRTAGEGE
jgi:cobalt-zinc-cadmium efflux system membrane fusion protein